MRIKARLRIYTCLGISMVFLVIIFYIWHADQSRKFNQSLDILREIRGIVFERIILRDEYLLYRSERATLQYRSKSGQIMHLLEKGGRSFKKPLERQIISELYESFKETDFIFLRIREIEERENVNIYRKTAYSEGIKRLTSRLISEEYEILQQIQKLIHSTKVDAIAVNEKLHLILIAFAIAVVIGFTANSLAINRLITRRIVELGRGANKIGEGNLNYRIKLKGNDELTDLAGEINEMTERLMQSHTSVKNLQREIEERKNMGKALRESEAHYKTLFNEVQDGICLADAETGIIVDCNHALEALVCRDRSELIGRPQKILHPFQDNTEAVSITFKQHITDKQGQIIETQIVTGAGDVKEVDIKASILNLNGKNILQGVFHDTTIHKHIEDALRLSLHEKEFLLREIHHRVKNNLQIISSLLILEADSGRERNINTILEELGDRVRAMSLLHEKLCQSHEITNINMRDYINDMAALLIGTYEIQSNKINLIIDVENIPFSFERAIPFGLILNELITNAIKHAFPSRQKHAGVEPSENKGQKNEITIILKEIRGSTELPEPHKKQIALIVSDNGIGLSPELDIRNAPTLGIRLIHILAEGQLKGTVSINHDKGTTFHIIIPGGSNG